MIIFIYLYVILLNVNYTLIKILVYISKCNSSFTDNLMGISSNLKFIGINIIEYIIFIYINYRNIIKISSRYHVF